MRRFWNTSGIGCLLAILSVCLGCTSLPSSGTNLVPDQEDQNLAVQLIDYRMRTAILDRPWRPPFRASIQTKEIEKHYEFRSSNRSIRGGLFVVDNTSIVVFDGSRGIEDLLLSFQLLGVRLRRASGEALAGYTTEFLKWESEDGIRELVRQIRIVDTGKLIVCGYSLGGDYSLLLAYWLKAEFGIPCTVTTLNSPQMGGAEFASTYGALGIPTINYTYGNDPVSQFPPSWLGWVNPGRTIHIGGPRSFFVDWDSHYLEHFYQIVDSNFVFAGPSSIAY